VKEGNIFKLILALGITSTTSAHLMFKTASRQNLALIEHGFYIICIKIVCTLDLLLERFTFRRTQKQNACMYSKIQLERHVNMLPRFSEIKKFLDNVALIINNWIVFNIDKLSVAVSRGLLIYLYR